MYPFIRLAWQMFKHRKDTQIAPTDTHISHHYCLPWDIDLWMELNNGRTLTLYDMARIPLARKAGLLSALRDNEWGLTMAGCSVRYRRRVRMFEKIEIRSRLVCFDDKFMYLEQSMWKKNGECANHVLYRSAVTDKNGIVPTSRVREAVGLTNLTPTVPDWIKHWIDADATRPWPPMPTKLNQN